MKDMSNLNIDIEIIEKLKAIVGSNNYIDDIGQMDAYLTDAWGRAAGCAPLVLRPLSTKILSSIVKLCNEHRVGVVPLGGNTGLVGGGTPSDSGEEIVVSLERMNQIISIDSINYTMTVEAGCVLADVQKAASEANRLFPLSLGAEGSCQIGGNLSTNAGGTAVLRYGNAQELVLGLEVVMPDGTVYEGLRGLRKDNTGYDLKQLFLGAEGTLGIITKAVLKLFPLPIEKVTSLVAISSVQSAPKVLSELRGITGDNITAFEYMDRICVDMLEEHTELKDPFTNKYNHFALVELTSSRENANLQTLFEEAVTNLIEEGDVVDAVVASSETQAAELWKMREMVPEVYRLAGGGLTFDISVPVSSVPNFIEKADKACISEFNKGVPIAFGHVGDGNIHYIFHRPSHISTEEFYSATEKVSGLVYDIAVGLSGSFSAEHGIGTQKRPDLFHYKSEREVSLMQTIKKALDPNNIMNPGKVV